MRQPRSTAIAVVAGLLAVALASAVHGQHYDAFYVLPGETGQTGAEVGLVNADVGSLGDATSLPVVGKYSISDDLEVGLRLDVGTLTAGAGSLSRVQAGAKLGLAPATALTAAALAPVGDADDAGLSVGIMHTVEVRAVPVNNWVQVGLLDGYTGGAGVSLSLLVEPAVEFGDRVTTYLDLAASTNTDGLSDHLAVNLSPNADYMFSERLAVNAGLSLGLAGDMKQGDFGITAMGLISF